MAVQTLEFDGVRIDFDADRCAEWRREEQAEAARGHAHEVAQVRRRLPEAATWARFGDQKFAAHTKFAGAVLDAARSWSRARGSALWLGQTGVGKTLSMLALANRVLDVSAKEGVSPADRAFAVGLAYVTADGLIRARKGHGLGHGEPDEIRTARSASLLLLDELGSEGTDHDATLFALVDQRYAAGRPTIIASGMTEAAFRSKYGDALARRVTDCGEIVSLFNQGGEK
jgi:DNA replication protein DnaC